MSVILGAGMVGKALMHEARRRSEFAITLDRDDADFTDRKDTYRLLMRLRNERPNENQFFITAGLVGGIADNMNRHYDYFMENGMIALNLIDAINKNFEDVNVFYYSSSCVYPPDLAIMDEMDLYSGLSPEETNIGYAEGKLLGHKASWFGSKFTKNKFVTIIPPNLYGPLDKINGTNSHVVGALIYKMIEAKKKGGRTKVEIWGDGTQKRELMHVDDLARASFDLMAKAPTIPYHLLNVGTQKEYTVTEIANAIRDIMDVDCEFVYNKDKPVGMKRKLLNSYRFQKLLPDWKPTYDLNDGLRHGIDWYMRTYYPLGLKFL